MSGCIILRVVLGKILLLCVTPHKELKLAIIQQLFNSFIHLIMNIIADPIKLFFLFKILFIWYLGVLILLQVACICLLFLVWFNLLMRINTVDTLFLLEIFIEFFWWKSYSLRPIFFAHGVRLGFIFCVAIWAHFYLWFVIGVNKIDIGTFEPVHPIKLINWRNIPFIDE